MDQSETFDFDPTIKILSQHFAHCHHVLNNLLSSQQENLDLCLLEVSQIGQEFASKVLENPDSVIKANFSYLQDYFTLCKNFLANSQENNEQVTATVDEKFPHSEVLQSSTIFEFINNNYRLATGHFRALIQEITSDADPIVAKKLNFYSRYISDAISPANFINTNPEALNVTLETNGKNIVDGFKNFLSDLERSKGFLNIKMTDLDHFKVGENVAATAGKVIYKNDVMELIQYDPITTDAYKSPLLIIPPWINKYYILDLQPENSFIKWLLAQGQTVFLISWVNPTRPEDNKSFADYMIDGPVAALQVIGKIVGKEPINLLGYCVGGTMLGCTLAYLASQNKINIGSATFLTTLLDFSEPGDLGVFIDQPQLNALEKHMSKKGYLDGHIMSAVFNSLRSKDLVWNYFINNYLKGQKPSPFDFLYWNSDPTNIPAKLHSFYLSEMYLHNKLMQPGAIELAGTPIDLSKIDVPCYFLAAKDDHIVPWSTSYQSMRLITAQTKFVLTKSGHVAGVINPPQKNKYGYWVNNRKIKDPAKWMESAQYHQGSWWNDWQEWLVKYSGRKLPVTKLNHKSFPVLEQAPGSYVKIHLAGSG